MLTLTIKKKWFDMIMSGEKKEEYREIKPYYDSRFRHVWQRSFVGGKAPRKIRFRNGYSADSPSFIAACTLDVGEGQPEWGAEPGKQYYRLHILSVNNEKDPKWFKLANESINEYEEVNQADIIEKFDF